MGNSSSKKVTPESDNKNPSTRVARSHRRSVKPAGDVGATDGISGAAASGAGDDPYSFVVAPRKSQKPEKQKKISRLDKFKTCDDDVVERKSKSGGIEVSEAQNIRYRKSQQDAVFVGVAKEPGHGDLMEDAIVNVVDRHKDCLCGTTLCAVSLQRIPPFAGTGGDIKITVGHLGDSRAALIIRHKDGSYESILLTQDHDLYLPRVVDFIKKNGGVIARDQRIKESEPEVLRVNDSLNMGASVGDAKLECLSRTPDVIKNLMVSKFLYEVETLGDVTVNLVLSCDGLWDLDGKKTSLGFDHRVVYEVEENKFKFIEKDGVAGFNLNGCDFHLSKLKERFDSEEGLVLDGTKFTNFSDALVYLAIHVGRSTDNISVVNIPITVGGVVKIKYGERVGAIICDGHGSGSLDFRDGKKFWDGSLVSFSVARELAAELGLKEVRDLVINPERKKLYEGRFTAKPSTRPVGTSPALSSLLAFADGDEVAEGAAVPAAKATEVTAHGLTNESSKKKPGSTK